MEAAQIIALLKKYKTGTLDPEEKGRLESWYISQASSSGHEISEEELEKSLSLLREGLPLKYRTASKMVWLRVPVAAAVILIAMATAVYLYINKWPVIQSEPATAGQDRDIVPGGNKAILYLADGSTIDLSSEKDGIITGDGQFTYKDGTPIRTYPEKVGKSADQITVSTPKGGQYQVRLPDGTNVWLNAASSLKYPASFTGMKERQVELSGEAYFEVAKDTAKPFLVVAYKQTVEVLGTHFNISSYTDEPVVKTTLLEGSVEVRTNLRVPGATTRASKPQKLRPGQQTILNKAAASLKVQEVDIEEAVAWKNGMFRFNNERLESIMRKVSRWYNVEVVYEDESLKAEPFVGVITRVSKVSNVLRMLELAGEVHFRIEDSKIIVMQ